MVWEEKGQKNEEKKYKKSNRRKNHTSISLILKSNIGVKKLDSKAYYK